MFVVDMQVLKTQDLAYVQTQRSSDERKAAKLRESLHMLDAEPQNKHTIFFDSEKKARRCVAPYGEFSVAGITHVRVLTLTSL